MDKQALKQHKITTEPVHKLVIEYAIPSIVCMLISSLYNLVDTMFVGRLDTQSTAAIGIVFPYMALIQSFSFFFGHGSGNYISRALGARQTDDAKNMAASGFFCALFLSIAVSLVSLLFSTPVLKALGSTDTILPAATGYFRYILLGTPFISLCFVLNNQMRHQGNAMLSMYGIMSGTILNIILDPILIFGCGMGVSGAGLATAISQGVSFVVMLSICGKRGGIRIEWKNFRFGWNVLKEINAGGLPSLTRQGLMSIAAVVLNNLANDYGDASVAAFSIVSRVMMFASAALLGFGQGFQPVCGFNFGAGKYDRVRKAFWFSVSVASAYSAVCSVLGLVFAPDIIRCFRAEDAEVVAIGSRVLRWQCAVFTLVGFIIPTNMFLQTIRKVVPAVIVAMARQGLFFLPLLVIGQIVAGLTGIILAQPVADILSFIVCIPFTMSALKGMQYVPKKV